MNNEIPTLTRSISQACALLKAGNIVAIPTETVYGLAADATQDQAVAKIYTFKNRPQFNPLIVHVLNLEQASSYVDITPLAYALAEQFWPGPLTFVLPLKENSPISLLCTGGLKTLAIRAPSHPIAQEILRTLGKPLAAPSANPSMSLSPTSVAHVKSAFSNKNLTIVEGGDCSIGLESTIIDLSRERPTLLRYGAITKEQLEERIGKPLNDYRHTEAISSPGQMLKHYSPSKSLRINVAVPSKGEGYLNFGPNHLPHTPSLNLSPAGDLQEAGANLFKMLHQLDEMDIERIAVAPIPPIGLGLAINDKLRRASYQK